MLSAVQNCSIWYLTLLCILSFLGLGTIAWSPLACGFLTGKYEDGTPNPSRAMLKVGDDDSLPRAQLLQLKVREN